MRATHRRPPDPYSATLPAATRRRFRRKQPEKSTPEAGPALWCGLQSRHDEIAFWPLDDRPGRSSPDRRRSGPARGRRAAPTTSRTARRRVICRLATEEQQALAVRGPDRIAGAGESVGDASRLTAVGWDREHGARAARSRSPRATGRSSTRCGCRRARTEGDALLRPRDGHCRRGRASHRRRRRRGRSGKR